MLITSPDWFFYFRLLKKLMNLQWKVKL